MTTIQEVLFELETDYYGHPYYVSGHALYTAIARRLDDGAGQRLSVSNGVFLPGEYCKITGDGGPSESLYTTSLEPVETYDDLFRFRDSAQRWLLDSRPRDAHNALALQTHGGRVAMSPTCLFGKPPENHYTKRSVTWFVHCYVHDDGTGVVPLDEGVLDGLRVGGARNYGLGELRLKDSQRVDLEALNYSRLRAASETVRRGDELVSGDVKGSWDGDQYNIELLSPYVLRSQHPCADDQSMPWWWDTPHELRRRQEQIVVGEDVYELDVIDHGQRVAFTGSDPVSTAKNGVLRVGSHSKFGFGEFRLRPVSDNRVTWSDAPETVVSRSHRSGPT